LGIFSVGSTMVAVLSSFIRLVREINENF